VVDVWHIHIIPLDAAADFLAAALAGDAEARRLLAACRDVHRRLATVTEPSHSTTSCMVCNTRFWRGHAPEVIVLVAEYDNDDDAPTTFGICGRCYDTHATALSIKNAVLAGCGVRLGTPLRQRPLPVAAGHA
jgi:hypothetical protein